MDLLRVQDITESYQAENGEIFALDHISFSMEKGEFVSIVGPSGCGKSTLLSIIARLLDAEEGNVLYRGLSLYDYCQDTVLKIGYMLQKDHLFAVIIIPQKNKKSNRSNFFEKN